ncbi:S9 family peptidase [Massilia sp. YIM B04103]|uniref:alpha/beta hydrolase family protein n=1 Tax=Massilia sp. YIM B04103 TaxID=2963106 RepID=UPI002109BEC4|nr:prolyl oligopeptidase family serine peptidase [Massilia sp. YIM B04103]
MACKKRIIGPGLRALALAIGLAASAVVPTPAVAAPAPVPLAAFFDNADFGEAVLSPSGKFLAAKVGGADRREGLVVVDLSQISVQLVARFADADVDHVQWVNEDRLLFDTIDKRIGVGDRRFAPGMFAVDRDGKNFRQLVNRNANFIQPSGAARLLPWHTYMMGQRGAQNSDYVYVRSQKMDGPGELRYSELLRLNTRNGHVTSVGRPADTRAWMLDDTGEPRLTWGHEKGVQIIYLREQDGEKGSWRKLASFNAYGIAKQGFDPLAFGPDGTLYVVSYHAGNDKKAVHTLDLATGQVSAKPLIELDGFDFSGHLIFGRGKLLGIRYVREARDTLWLDPDMKQMQAEIDAKLPNTINLLTVPSRPETPNVLVRSYSDRQPTVTLIYNSESKTFNKVGDSRPQIRASEMAGQRFLRYKARDGLEIPALLTLPNDKEGQKVPLVVLVHGGPWVRGSSWGWDADAQFLASRGYAVLEPEFRGSTGFGGRHLQAGFKQWGLKMQDDIADGAKWAIAEGVADPQRICIAGASYGGYATLMGLARNPELFKCGVNWIGVTDIQLMYSGHWSAISDLSEQWKEYGMPQLIGDPEKDAEQLKATSPLLLAARIRQPLLLAYGGADQRVPIYHGTKFRDAVTAHNKDVEWIEYAEEGHGWTLPKNRIDFWGRVEKFLDRNIGKGAEKK